MADDDTVITNYVWTQADRHVTTSPHKKDDLGYPQCYVAPPEQPHEHGCYVTPYGILLPKPDTRLGKAEVGETIAQDLLALEGVTVGPWAVWRATRFYVHTTLPDPATPPDCRWVEVDVPDDVPDLDGLCAYLMNLDPVKYPSRIYGIKPQPPAKIITLDSRKMLFDHWFNAKHRASIVQKWDDEWSQYSFEPGKLPVSRPKMFVAEVKSVGKATPIPPNGTTTIKRDDVDIDGYIRDLEAYCGELEELRKQCAELWTARMRILSTFHCVAVIAELTKTGAEQSQADQLVAELRTVEESNAVPERRIAGTGPFAARAQEWLVTMPFIDLKSTKHLSSDIERKRSLIHALMFGQEHVQLLKDFGVQVIVELNAGAEKDPSGLLAPDQSDPACPKPKVLEQLDRLCHAMARATGLLADTGVVEDGDVYEALLDGTKAARAFLESDLVTTSPVATVLSMIGKTAGIGPMVAGNLAGPPSLAVAATAAYGTLKTGADAAKAKGVAAYQAIKAKVGGALSGISPDLGKVVEGDEAATARTHREVANDRASGVHVTPFWKNCAIALQVFGFVSALVSNLSGEETKVIDWIGLVPQGAGIAAGVGEVYVVPVLEAKGWVEVAEVAGQLSKAARYFGYAGNVIGIVSAIIGIIGGALEIYESWKAGRRVQAKHVLAIVGNAGMGIASIMGFVAIWRGTVVHPAAWPIAAIALALLIISSLLDVPADGAAKKYCLALLRGLRLDHEWLVLSGSDPALGKELERIISLCDELTLPDLPRTDETRLRLREAFIADDAIRQICPTDVELNPYADSP